MLRKALHTMHLREKNDEGLVKAGLWEYRRGGAEGDFSTVDSGGFPMGGTGRPTAADKEGSCGR